MRPQHVIISKLCNGSDLYNVTKYIYDNGDSDKNIYNLRSKLTVTNIVHFLIEIAQGLKYLHSNDVVHRHCHSKNVFIHYKNGIIGDIETPNNIQLKIADFNYSGGPNKRPFMIPIPSNYFFVLLY